MAISKACFELCVQNLATAHTRYTVVTLINFQMIENTLRKNLTGGTKLEEQF